MVTFFEIVLLLAVLALLLGAYRVVRALRPFIVNAVVGLLVLVIASALGASVDVSPLVVLVCAVGGVPGAILVLLLAYLDVAFAATVASGVAVAVP